MVTMVILNGDSEHPYRTPLSVKLSEPKDVLRFSFSRQYVNIHLFFGRHNIYFFIYTYVIFF